MFNEYLYGAYGSNLNMGQMSYRCPNATPLGSFNLIGWKLVFRNVADIERCEKSSVPIGVWKITNDCERKLDVYEGYPSLYGKEFLNIDGIKGAFGTSQLMIYTMNDQNRIGNPSPSYYETIANGYEDFDIDPMPLAIAKQDTSERVAKLLPESFRFPIGSGR